MIVIVVTFIGMAVLILDATTSVNSKGAAVTLILILGLVLIKCSWCCPFLYQSLFSLEASASLISKLLESSSAKSEFALFSGFIVQSFLRLVPLCILQPSLPFHLQTLDHSVVGDVDVCVNCLQLLILSWKNVGIIVSKCLKITQELGASWNGYTRI